MLCVATCEIDYTYCSFRAAWHRLQLYKVLYRSGYHVITFDYRGE